MKLKHITFTGIDAQTDLKRLEAIQKSYPIAEFGVLTSYHWYENGNRFLDPRMFRRLTTWSNLHLSLHLCGRVAHDAVRGDWSGLNYLSWGEYLSAPLPLRPSISFLRLGRGFRSMDLLIT